MTVKREQKNVRDARMQGAKHSDAHRRREHSQRGSVSYIAGCSFRFTVTGHWGLLLITPWGSDGDRRLSVRCDPLGSRRPIRLGQCLSLSKLPFGEWLANGQLVRRTAEPTPMVAGRAPGVCVVTSGEARLLRPMRHPADL